MYHSSQVEGQKEMSNFQVKFSISGLSGTIGSRYSRCQPNKENHLKIFIFGQDLEFGYWVGLLPICAPLAVFASTKEILYKCFFNF